MSQTAKNHDQPSIDAILKGLSSRPNVQATLILSRKDGSIIRATGVAGPDESTRPISQRFNGTPLNGSVTAPQETSVETSQQETERSQKKELSNPAQQLAGSIYEFVKISSDLAASMTESSVAGTGSTGNVMHGTAKENQGGDSRTGTAVDEEDIQLLRMRTKRQEIIIFPDPNYLCCVVQNLTNKENRPQ